MRTAHFLIPGKGVYLQRPPWTETPWTEIPGRNMEPGTETPQKGHRTRQEDRKQHNTELPPMNRMTDASENITLPSNFVCGRQIQNINTIMQISYKLTSDFVDKVSKLTGSSNSVIDDAASTIIAFRKHSIF